jgi:RNA polymerase sigma-B factor
VLTLTELPGLAGLDDLELLTLVSSLPRASGRRAGACEQLVGRYRGLVWSCVQRYRFNQETTEDLMQVGYVGLMKAINNFDPAIGRPLGAYAEPYITGEIKRYFRDGRWHVHVARPAKELAAQIRAATPRLAQDLGRTPSGPDLARHLGVSHDELRDAQLAEVAFRPTSLDAPLSARADAGSLADLLGADDPRIEHVLGMQSLAMHWGELAPGEQEILRLRFYGGLTQDQIGHQLGISQMQVSRRLSRALRYLRPRVFGSQYGTEQTSASW